MSWKNFPSQQPAPYAPASNPKNATWDRDASHNGDPEIKAWNLSYNAELPVSADLKFYSFATYGDRDTVSGNSLRFPNSNANFSTIFPDGHFPVNNGDETDYEFVFGGKGLIAGWNLDLSTSYGKNRVRQWSELSLNPSLGPTSPTRFDELATYQFEQWVTNADFTRAFDFGLKKPVQLSWGLEHRWERFSTEAGDPEGYTNGGYIFQPGDQEGDPNVGKPATPGAQAGVSLSPADEVDVKRRVAAAYADVSFNPLEKWFVGTALRFEHYDDSTGNTIGGKLNSRYDFNPVFAVRGTVGTGFRAPSLAQGGYSQTDNRTVTTASGLGVPGLSKLLLNDSALARALGAQDLDPEESTNFGLGFVFTPAKDVNITVDAYQVKIKDRIVRTNALEGPALAGLLTANGLVESTRLTYFANAVDTRSRGLDIVADIGTSLGAYGFVRWGAAFNWNKTEITKVANTPSQLAAIQAQPNPGGSLVWFGLNGRSALEDTPRTKLILSGRWQIHAFDINLATTRYGSYGYQPTGSDNPAHHSKHAARWITDLDVGYNFESGAKVSLGANNLFNVYPEKSGIGDANFGQRPYTYGNAPFAPTGASYYVKLAYDF
jgi:iron complex outermembrane receptor protein